MDKALTDIQNIANQTSITILEILMDSNFNKEYNNTKTI